MGQRPAVLTPHASPRSYWGAELRAARERQKLSLARLGERIHRDPSYLAKLERGEREIPAHIAEECDTELGADGSLVRLLALVNSPDSQHVIQVAPSGAHVANSRAYVANHADSGASQAPSAALWEEDGDNISVPARTADGQVIYVNISRRQLLGGAAATAGGALASTVTAANPHSLPAAALAPTGNPVDHFRQMKRVLMDSDNMFGPTRVISTVQQQISIMEGLRPSWRGEDHRALVSVQTQFADLLGWLYQDSGDYANARYWIDRSLEWSHVAREPITTAFTLVRRSQLAADMGHATDAVDAAEAALGMVAHQDSPRISGIAATFAAHGHALRGDNSASAHAYDQARETLPHLHADSSAYALHFDQSYLNVYEGHSMAALEKHTTAASIFESAIANLPTNYHRDQAVYRTWQALAHAGAEDVEQAADLGLKALSITNETDSTRARNELAQLDSKLAPWSDVPLVRDLHSAIQHQ